MEYPKKKKQADKIREQSLNYDDYANLPDDGMRYELADGVLEAMSPSPSAKHQLVSQEIEHRLKRTCFNDFVIISAPIDVILSEKEVRQPDIIILHRHRLSLITKRGVEGAPDLVVEILSPHSIKRDRQAKLTVYAMYGIPEYWIVDYEMGALEQYTLEDRRYVLTEVFFGESVVHSKQIPCASFTMNNIINSLPELPNF